MHGVRSPCLRSLKCVSIEDWGECTFEKNPKKPWRVDNDCKDTLDKLALRLQQMPNGKLDIVGYTDEKEVVNEQTLGAQRSVNVKYYLTTDGPTKVDASRIQPREGGAKGKATHFYFVPEGTCAVDSWKRAPRLTKPRCSRSRVTRLLRRSTKRRPSLLRLQRSSQVP